MKRILALILACTFALGCQSEPEPTPEPTPEASLEASPEPTPEAAQTPAPTQKPTRAALGYPPSLRPLYFEGAKKLLDAIQDLPRPLQELQVETPANKTRYRLDPRELSNLLVNQLVKVKDLSVVSRDRAAVLAELNDPGAVDPGPAPWALKSTILSEEITTAAGGTRTTTLQLVIVGPEGQTVVSVEATQADRR